VAGETLQFVDMHHARPDPDWARAKSAGITGAILKATQGIDFRDPAFTKRRREAEAAGLICGAYHFGAGDGSGEQQADFFLEAVGDLEAILLVLDFEADPDGPDMTIDQARAFLQHLQANPKITQPIGLYSRGDLLGGVGDDPVFEKCWLWLARYGPQPIPPKPWKKLTMWQYTNGKLGPEPHKTLGIGRGDKNKFFGSLDDLEQLRVGDDGFTDTDRIRLSQVMNFVQAFAHPFSGDMSEPGAFRHAGQGAGELLLTALETFEKRA
jgi:Glycosyl hydrolases family 25